MKATAQQAAIFDNIANDSGHLLVTARAGTGKTTTIEHGVLHVPEDKSVLVLAFNKDIADAVKRRVKRPGAWVGTSHSFGFRALREFHGDLEVDHQRVRTLCRALVPHLRTRHYAIARAVSLVKAYMLYTIPGILEICSVHGVEIVDDRGQFAAGIQKIIEYSSAVTDTVDYDDMVWLPAMHPDVLPQYDYVFVDEAQDLNRAQFRMIEHACAPGGRVIAIGDDRQAIYSFRGAASNAIHRFRTEFKPKELPLSVSFRCAKRIIKEAQRIVPDITALPDAPDGKVAAIDYTALLDMVEYGDFILSRTNAPLLRTALKLAATDCAVQIAGRELGSELTAIIRRMGARSPVALVHAMAAWKTKCLRKLDDPASGAARDIADKYACVEALAEKAGTVNIVLSRIEQLFASRPAADCVTLSTTHRAKGLERDRVFILRDTYLRSRSGEVSEEESNLYYVAVTRAKHELYLTAGLPARSST
jgi:superfamily I DNA/RNA helicase